ncbi:MAG: class I SAM-dependent methyltransferase [Bryobacterales bacterium]|nr:class I SAM-dependent methyltransferase [Bryobacterales bacterium]
MNLRMYTELAEWWPLLSAPEDYEEEAAFYTKLLREAGEEPARSVLELGSGGGNNASHMKMAFAMTLTDLSPGMLEVSRKLNPECEHVQGDMRTLRLGREFDRVFVHDAICYMTSVDDLRGAVETAWVHCRAGGAALFAPDYVRETFRGGTDCGGNDGGVRGMRYLEWVWDPDPEDCTYTADYVFALRGEDGQLTVEHDRHVEGMFRREEWLEVLRGVGFEVRIVPFEHSEVEHGQLEVFLCTKC